MTDGRAEDADAIREAAAAWIARRHNGDWTSDDDAALERWLATDDRHRLTYQRMMRRFDNARVLGQSRLGAAPQPAWRARRDVLGIALAAAASLALVVFAGFPHHTSLHDRADGTDHGAGPALVRRRLAAPAGELRTIGLVDGSTVTLDRGSLVVVDFSGRQRQLTLLRGRARFAVAHEPRPFIVLAGHGTVTAHGTLFDVSLGASGNAHVLLLRGIVDVTGLRSSALHHGVATRRLHAGGAVEIGAAGDLTPPTATVRPTSVNWVDAAGSFDNVALADLVDRANRLGRPAIRLADPSLAALRISGRFGLNDPDRLATDLAALFDLRIERSADAIILHR